MAGTITHEWNGTILTITSDSGTSSMDLKGSQGDLGPRGPQGPAGIMLFEDLTEEQKESLKGDKGDSYILTDADKQEIAELVIASFPDGEESEY